jgi:hypothetical protein
VIQGKFQSYYNNDPSDLQYFDAKRSIKLMYIKGVNLTAITIDLLEEKPT